MSNDKNNKNPEKKNQNKYNPKVKEYLDYLWNQEELTIEDRQKATIRMLNDPSITGRELNPAEKKFVFEQYWGESLEDKRKAEEQNAFQKMGETTDEGWQKAKGGLKGVFGNFVQDLSQEHPYLHSALTGNLNEKLTADIGKKLTDKDSKVGEKFRKLDEQVNQYQKATEKGGEELKESGYSDMREAQIELKGKDSFWYDVGALLPQVLPAAASAITGAINPALGTAVGIGTITGLSASAAGSAMKQVDDYFRRNKGMEEAPDEWKYSIGLAAGVTEAALEAIPVKGVLKPLKNTKVGKRILGANVANELIKKPRLTNRIISDFAKQNPKVFKQFTKGIAQQYGREGGEEAGAELIQSSLHNIYMDKDDRMKFSNILKNSLDAAVKGGMLGGFIAPISQGGASVNNIQRWKKQGLNLVQTKDGNVYEVIGKEEDQYTGMTKDGKTVTFSKEDVTDAEHIEYDEYVKFKEHLKQGEKTAKQEERQLRAKKRVDEMYNEEAGAVVQYADEEGKKTILSGDPQNENPSNLLSVFNPKTGEKQLISPSEIDKTQLQYFDRQQAIDHIIQGEIAKEKAQQRFKQQQQQQTGQAEQQQQQQSQQQAEQVEQQTGETFNPENLQKGQTFFYKGENLTVDEVTPEKITAFKEDSEEEMPIPFEIPRSEFDQIKPAQQQEAEQQEQEQQQAEQVEQQQQGKELTITRGKEQEQYEAIDQGDGTFRINQIFTKSKEAEQVRKELEQEYSNLDFELINETPENDPFAKNQLSIIAKPKTQKDEQANQVNQKEDEGKEGEQPDQETGKEIEGRKEPDTDRENTKNKPEKQERDAERPKDTSPKDQDTGTGEIQFDQSTINEQTEQIEGMISDYLISQNAEEFKENPEKIGIYVEQFFQSPEYLDFLQNNPAYLERNENPENYELFKTALQNISYDRITQDIQAKIEHAQEVEQEKEQGHEKDNQDNKKADNKDNQEDQRVQKEQEQEQEQEKPGTDKREENDRDKVQKEDADVEKEEMIPENHPLNSYKYSVEPNKYFDSVIEEVKNKGHKETGERINTKTGEKIPFVQYKYTFKGKSSYGLRRRINKAVINEGDKSSLLLASKKPIRYKNNIIYILPESTFKNGSKNIEVVIEEYSNQEQGKEPTEAQKKAGNYPKEKRRIRGLEVAIENKKGSERSGTDEQGNEWSVTMQHDYGYFNRTKGKDGDQIDVFLSENPEEGSIFIIDQYNEDGSFDEHKVMLGFNSKNEALEAYKSNYEEGADKAGAITEVSEKDFKEWLNREQKNKRSKRKPFSELKSFRELTQQERIKPIKEKYKNTEKEYGREKTLKLPNGEEVKGKYVLIESGGVTPSHNPHNFSVNKGFPTNENGKIVNDRDYQNDKDAQAFVHKFSKNYDARAYQNPVIVSKDGIVLSGNNRTMSGELAAENNTDGNYIESLRDDVDMYGFTDEQFQSFEHPRLVFEIEQDLPYTTETFAKFNIEEGKAQNKVEQAVKMSKVLPDETITRIGDIIGNYERLSGFYQNRNDVKQVINILKENGIITDIQIPELMEGESFSTVGKDLLENVLLGSMLTEDSVRAINEEGMKQYRKKLVYSIVPLIKNKSFGENYDLIGEINQGIEYLRKKQTGDFENLHEMVMQPSIFENKQYDINSFYLAIKMEGKQKEFKKFIEQYNSLTENAAFGNGNLFLGRPKSKQEVINEFQENESKRTKQTLKQVEDFNRSVRENQLQKGNRKSKKHGRSDRTAQQRGKGKEQGLKQVKGEQQQEDSIHQKMLNELLSKHPHFKLISNENGRAVIETPIGKQVFEGEKYYKIRRLRNRATEKINNLEKGDTVKFEYVGSRDEGQIRKINKGKNGRITSVTIVDRHSGDTARDKKVNIGDVVPFENLKYKDIKDGAAFLQTYDPESEFAIRDINNLLQEYEISQKEFKEEYSKELWEVTYQEYQDAVKKAEPVSEENLTFKETTDKKEYQNDLKGVEAKRQYRKARGAGFNHDVAYAHALNTLIKPENVHKQWVKKAIKEGKNVPQRVLNEYPELQNQGKKQVNVENYQEGDPFYYKEHKFKVTTNPVDGKIGIGADMDYIESLSKQQQVEYIETLKQLRNEEFSLISKKTPENQSPNRNLRFSDFAEREGIKGKHNLDKYRFYIETIEEQGINKFDKETKKDYREIKKRFEQGKSNQKQKDAGQIPKEAEHITVSGKKTRPIEKTLDYNGIKFGQTSIQLGGGKDYQIHYWNGSEWKYAENSKLTKKDISRVYDNLISKNPDLKNQVKEPQQQYKSDLYEETPEFEEDTTHKSDDTLHEEPQQLSLFDNYERTEGNVEEEETYLERELNEQGQLVFGGEGMTGTTKIRNSDDIAFLFRNLEKAHSENSFAVLMKNDGSYQVLYLATGHTTGVPIDIKQVVVAAQDFGADSVCMVHNHPSGTLNPSNADKKMHGQLVEAMAEMNVYTMDSVIIDLSSGLYTTFSIKRTQDNLTINEEIEQEGDVVKPKTYQFDRQKLYVPSNKRTKITSPRHIAEFLSKQKRGTTPKTGVIILSQGNHINKISLLDETITSKEFKNKVKYLVGKYGEHVVLYSNRKFNSADLTDLNQSLKNLNSQLTDAIYIEQTDDILNNYRSFAENNLLGDPETVYKDSQVREPQTPYPEETVDEVLDNTEKEFVVTENPTKTSGYLTVRGDFVDLGDGRTREEDHRSIGKAYFEYDGQTDEEREIFNPGEYYTDSKWKGKSAPNMLAFMDMGNIRLMPESGGIDLMHKPNLSQRSGLKKYIRQHDGYVILDISNSYGNTEMSMEYEQGTPAKEIINDIVRYFEEGIKPNDALFKVNEPEPEYNPYISTIEKSLEKIKQEKGTPDQMKAMLIKNGAKKGELDWMQYDSQFANEKSVTKQDIQKWIDENKIEIKEVTKGGVWEPSWKDINERAEKLHQEMVNEQIDSFIEQEGREPTEDEKTDISNEISWPEDIAREQLMEEKADSDDAPKYEEHTLPGERENYTELLLTMPNKKISLKDIDKSKLRRVEIPYDENQRQGLALNHELWEERGEDYVHPKTNMRIDYFGRDEQTGEKLYVATDEQGFDMIGEAVSLLDAMTAIESEYALNNGIKYEVVEQGGKYYLKRGGEIIEEESYDTRKQAENAITYLPPQHHWIYKYNGKEYGVRHKPTNPEEPDLKDLVDKINVDQAIKKYQSSHFNESNVLAHVRFNERTDKDGNRILFIEEIQSDWAQEGKKKGFDLSPERKQQLDKRRKEIEEIGKENKRKGVETSKELKEEWADIMNELQPQKSRPPQMPFKKTDQWVNLTLRRMAQYAAENGFDGVAWTTGKQQADRYDLRKHVKKINVFNESNKFPNAKEPIYELEVTPKNQDGRQTAPIIYNNIPESQLENYIGKEMAEKVQSDMSNNETGQVKYEGLDLEVGGEGMKTFYDRIIPNQVSKIFKKFGVKKTGQTEIDLDGKTENVHAFPVTKDMKKLVSYGVPFFKQVGSRDIRTINEENPLNRLQFAGERLTDKQTKSFQKFKDSVRKIADKFGMSGVNIEVVDSASELPKRITANARKVRGDISGVFDPQTGNVYIVARNVKNTDAVKRILLHEVVAHKGLRNFLGGEWYNTLIDVYNSMDQSDIDRIGRKYGTNDETLIADEYIAEKAELAEKPSIVEKAIAKLKELIRRFINLDYTDSDIKVLLDRSRSYLESGKPLSTAENPSFKVEQEQEQEKSVDQDSPKFVDSPRKYFAEGIVDLQYSLRKAQELAEKRGGKVTEESNTYVKENLSYGKVREQQGIYAEDFEKPLNKVLGQIQNKHGISQKRTGDYLIAKHAIENNQYFRDKELKEYIENAQKKYIRDYKNKHNGEEPTEDQISKVPRQEAVQYKKEELAKESFSGMTDKEALEIIEEFENNVSEELVNELHDKVRKATKFTLDKWLEYDRISKTTHDDLLNRFDYYVPLRGWDDPAEDKWDFSSDVGDQVNTVKRRWGRKSKPSNPLPHIHSMAHATIIEGERNKVRKAFARFISINKNIKDKDGNTPVDGIATAHTIYSVDMGKRDELGNVIREERIERPPQDFFGKKNEYGEPLVKTARNNHYKVKRTRYQAEEHEIEVFINGKKYIIVADDPAVARAVKNDIGKDLMTIKNVLNFGLNDKIVERITGGYIKHTPGLGEITRTMGQLYTSYNPNFIAANTMRDVPLAMVSHFVEGDIKQTGKFIKNLRKANKALIKKKATKEETKRLKEELDNFKKFGGETGWMHLKNPEKFERKIRKRLKKVSKKGKYNPFNYSEDFFNYVEQLANYSENIARFATFLTYKELGYSNDYSAYQGKQVTVNFNKKGKWSGIFGANWVFFNAAMRGIVRYGELWKASPPKFALVHGILMAQGFLSSWLLDLFGGEDDEGVRTYDKINDYKKHNYLVLPGLDIYPEDDETIEIPMPHILRFFHMVGSLSYDMATGRKNASDAVAKGLGGLGKAFVPIDASGFATEEGEFSFRPLVPTYAIPFYDLQVNRDFAGYSIYKEPFTLAKAEQIADQKRYFKSINKMYPELTDFWFKLGGGNPETGYNYYYDKNGEMHTVPDIFDVNPEWIEHLTTSYLGGAGKFVNQVIATTINGVKTGQALFDKHKPFKQAVKNIDLNQVPILYRFLGRGYGDPIRENYYKANDYYRKYNQKLNEWKQQKNMDKYFEIYDAEEYYKTEMLQEFNQLIDELESQGKEEAKRKYIRKGAKFSKENDPTEYKPLNKK